MEQARTRKRDIRSFINSEKGRMIVLLILDYRRKRYWVSKALFKFLVAEILNLILRIMKDRKSFIVFTKAMLSILGNIAERGLYSTFPKTFAIIKLQLMRSRKISQVRRLIGIHNYVIMAKSNLIYNLR